MYKCPPKWTIISLFLKNLKILWSQIFSSRNISPIVSDIFTLRYNHISTDCFLSEKEGDDVIIQIIGHANNYSKNSPYKRAQDESLIYGTLIDLYGKYDGDYKSFVICLDNSNFFNSVLEEDYKSRATFIFDNNNNNTRKQNSIDTGQTTSYGGLYKYKVQSKIAFINIYKNDITNTSNASNNIIIDTSLFDALLDFKKMQDNYWIFNSSGAGSKDKHRFFNYYGTNKSNNNIYLSTIGVTNISELNNDELKLIERVMEKRNFKTITNDNKNMDLYRNNLKNVMLRIKTEIESVEDTIENLEKNCKDTNQEITLIGKFIKDNCEKNEETIKILRISQDQMTQLYKLQPFNEEYDILYKFDEKKHTSSRFLSNPEEFNLAKELNIELDMILDAIEKKKNLTPKQISDTGSTKKDKQAKKKEDKTAKKEEEGDLKTFIKDFKTNYKTGMNVIKQCKKKQEKDCSSFTNLNDFIITTGKEKDFDTNITIQEAQEEVKTNCKKDNFLNDTDNCILSTLKVMYQQKILAITIFIKKIIEYSVLKDEEPSTPPTPELEQLKQEIIDKSEEHNIYYNKTLEKDLNHLNDVKIKEIIKNIIKNEEKLQEILKQIFIELLEAYKKANDFKSGSIGDTRAKKIAEEKAKEIANIKRQLEIINVVLEDKKIEISNLETNIDEIISRLIPSPSPESEV